MYTRVLLVEPVQQLVAVRRHPDTQSRLFLGSVVVVWNHDLPRKVDDVILYFLTLILLEFILNVLEITVPFLHIVLFFSS